MMEPLDQQTALEIRYEKAIKTLLDIAMVESDLEAKFIAGVLLSANGMRKTPGQIWKVNLGHMAFLNRETQNTTLGVTHARVSLRRHPETTITEGPKLFKLLWRRWINVEEWPPYLLRE